MNEIIYCTTRDKFMRELHRLRNEQYTGLGFNLSDINGYQWNLNQESTVLIPHKNTKTVEVMSEDDVQRLQNEEDEPEQEYVQGGTIRANPEGEIRINSQPIDCGEVVVNPSKFSRMVRKQFLQSEIKKHQAKITEYSRELFELDKDDCQ